MEQTEFVDDKSFVPFKSVGNLNYERRCCSLDLESPNKLKYISKHQLAGELVSRQATEQTGERADCWKRGLFRCPDCGLLSCVFSTPEVLDFFPVSPISN